MGVQRLYGTLQKKIDSLNIFFFGVLNSSGDGFSITPSAAYLKTRYSDIYSIKDSSSVKWSNGGPSRPLSSDRLLLLHFESNPYEILLP